MLDSGHNLLKTVFFLYNFGESLVLTLILLQDY